MAVKFFGQFLVEKGAVSRIDLLQAIELQEKTNLKFGEMVVAMGLMTDADVDRIHLAQRKEDLHFGDMAVKLESITAEQVEQVLEKQRSTHLYIGEALVKVGALTEQQLGEQLNNFKQDQKGYSVGKVEIPLDSPDRPIWEMAADLSYKMLTRVAGISYRPGACTLVDKLPVRPVIAEMGLGGSVNARYMMLVSEGPRDQIAKAILEQDSIEEEPDEVLDDCVKEFINIICGNIAAKAAGQGKNIEITPPEMVAPEADGISLPPGHSALLFPIHQTDGESFELAIVITTG